MVVEVKRADISEEERQKRLHRIAVIAGIMLTEIKEKGIKPNERK